ncbi:hypothetical protein T265_12853, partial [Opisthorchis viverrini]
PVSFGVPQGSVLGPLLFLIYVNDLPDVLASQRLLLADDLKSWSSNASTLQIDVDAAKQWSLDWHLPLNDEKCVHVSFGGDSANAFVMHGEKGPENIKRMDAKKDLGISVSSDLSFSLHHEKSAQKAFAILRMIRRTLSRITHMDAHTLYGAYVRPLLEYANQVVYSGRTKDDTLIERVQRAATKLIAGLKSVDYETRLAMLDIIPTEYSRFRGDLILTYALFEQSLANRYAAYVVFLIYSRIARSFKRKAVRFIVVGYEGRKIFFDSLSYKDTPRALPVFFAGSQQISLTDYLFGSYSLTTSRDLLYSIKVHDFSSSGQLLITRFLNDLDDWRCAQTSGRRYLGGKRQCSSSVPQMPARSEPSLHNSVAACLLINIEQVINHSSGVLTNKPGVGAPATSGRRGGSHSVTDEKQSPIGSPLTAGQKYMEASPRRFYRALFEHCASLSVLIETLVSEAFTAISKVTRSSWGPGGFLTEIECCDIISSAYAMFLSSFLDFCVPRLHFPVWSSLNNALTIASEGSCFSADEVRSMHVTSWLNMTLDSSTFPIACCTTERTTHDTLVSLFVRGCFNPLVSRGGDEHRYFLGQLITGVLMLHPGWVASLISSCPPDSPRFGTKTRRKSGSAAVISGDSHDSGISSQEDLTVSVYSASTGSSPTHTSGMALCMPNRLTRDQCLIAQLAAQRMVSQEAAAAASGLHQHTSMGGTTGLGARTITTELVTTLHDAGHTNPSVGLSRFTEVPLLIEKFVDDQDELCACLPSESFPGQHVPSWHIDHPPNPSGLLLPKGMSDSSPSLAIGAGPSRPSSSSCAASPRCNASSVGASNSRQAELSRSGHSLGHSSAETPCMAVDSPASPQITNHCLIGNSILDRYCCGLALQATSESIDSFKERLCKHLNQWLELGPLVLCGVIRSARKSQAKRSSDASKFLSTQQGRATQWCASSLLVNTDSKTVEILTLHRPSEDLAGPLMPISHAQPRAVRHSFSQPGSRWTSRESSCPKTPPDDADYPPSKPITPSPMVMHMLERVLQVSERTLCPSLALRDLEGALYLIYSRSRVLADLITKLGPSVLQKTDWAANAIGTVLHTLAGSTPAVLLTVRCLAISIASAISLCDVNRSPHLKNSTVSKSILCPVSTQLPSISVTLDIHLCFSAACLFSTCALRLW